MSGPDTIKIFRKSRKGCVQCKARKVKCDETKPECNRCARLKRQCLYMRPGIGFSGDSSGSQLTPPHVELRYDLTYKPMQMDQLELLHHFTTITSKVTNYEVITENLWQITIPRLSFSQEYLMHGLLAMSALHLAYLNGPSDPHYRRLAAAHQQAALKLCRPALANPDEQNGSALFAFVLLNIYYAFAAAATDPPTDGYPLESVLQCLNMLRGLKLMVDSVREHLRRGPLTSMLSMRYTPSSSITSSLRDEAYLESLVDFCHLHSTSESSDFAIYAPAATSLLACFRKTASIPPGWHKSPTIFEWAQDLPQEFFDRLVAAEPLALILTGHYCCLLTQIKYYWWIQDWADRTLAVLQTLLPWDYLVWLDWPVEQIRRVHAVSTVEEDAYVADLPMEIEV